MICTSKTGRTDTRSSWWGQKSMNVFHRICFLKLKPIPQSLWSPQVMSSPCNFKAHWLSIKRATREETSWLCFLGCRLAPTQQEHWWLPAPHNPTTQLGGLGKVLSFLTYQLFQQEQEVTTCSWVVNHEPRQHIFCRRLTANKLLLFSELCLGTLTNIFL